MQGLGHAYQNNGEGEGEDLSVGFVTLVGRANIGRHCNADRGMKQFLHETLQLWLVRALHKPKPL